MNDEQIVRAVASFVIVGLLVPATLWYLGIRFAKPQLKIWGIIVGTLYVLLFGFNVAHEWFDFFPVVYQTDMYGPDHEEASVVSDITYQVNVAGSRNEMVLTPIPKYGEKPAAPLTLSSEVQSPTGQVAKGRETLHWTPLKTEFTSLEEGVHKVIVVIPKPVRKVRIAITERKK